MKRKIKFESRGKQNWGAAFWSVPGWDPQKIKDAKVMVVGAGALGNEVVKNLTLLNVGHLVIIDFDVVEYNNLAKSVLFRKEDKGAKKAHAMAKNLKVINDEVKTLPLVADISTDVGLGVFRRVDVILGCLDNRLARLYINQHAFKVGKTWVDGALENMAGTFSVYTPNVSCYECGLSETARDNITFRMGCPDIARRNANVGSIATTPVSSSIIGAFQVQEALKIIFGNTQSSMAGESFVYDGMNNFFLKYKGSNLRPDCDSHIFFDEIIEAKGLSHEHTVGQLLDWLEKHFGTKDLLVRLDEEVVLQAVCTKSGQVCNTAIYKNHLFEAPEVLAVKRQPDEGLYVEQSTNALDRSFPYPDRRLKDIGIPFLEILKVEVNNDVQFVELSGDEKKFTFK